jgi:peptidoglycan-associated lipoprotein
MMRKSFGIFIFVLCLGFFLAGCPKKTVMKEEPSSKAAEELAMEKERTAKLEAEQTAKLEAERTAKLEAERTAKEAREKELEKLRTEETRKAREKELERSLLTKKEPGIEGEIFESTLLKDIHFDFDKYDVRLGDTEILQGNAALLMKYPAVRIEVEGHCDERGTVEYNLALGERRANSTKQYLISLGVSADRISTISYGEERPLDPGHNEEAWAKNRRAHFTILSK